MGEITEALTFKAGDLHIKNRSEVMIATNESLKGLRIGVTCFYPQSLGQCLISTARLAEDQLHKPTIGVIFDDRIHGELF